MNRQCKPSFAYEPDAVYTLDKIADDFHKQVRQRAKEIAVKKRPDFDGEIVITKDDIEIAVESLLNAQGFNKSVEK
jgi:hypothetical protein